MSQAQMHLAGSPLPTRVLIADDEHLMATGLASSVGALGMNVIGPVPDGSKAIEASRLDPPDLAILDIRMPGIDGLEAASVLWKEFGVPSVIVSAYSDEDYLSRAQETGVFGYLLKPVSTEHLRAAVSIAWSRANNHGDQAKRIAQLERTLENRKVVELAKWRIIEQEKISEADAHTRLQRIARNSRRTLAEVAREVLDTGTIGD